MELENVSSSNNDLANAGQSGRGSRVEATASPKAAPATGVTDENEVELDVNSPNASNVKAANGQNGNQNLDQSHCARNFFCWCCSCCSCLK